MERVLERAGVESSLGIAGGAGDVHIAVLVEKGKPRFLVVVNRGESVQQVGLDFRGNVRGLFTEAEWIVDGVLSVPGHFVDLLVVSGRSSL